MIFYEVNCTLLSFYFFFFFLSLKSFLVNGLLCAMLDCY